MKYLLLILLSLNAQAEMSDANLKDCINGFTASPQGIEITKTCDLTAMKVELKLEEKCKVIQSAVRIRNKRKGLTGASKLQFLNKVKDIASAINSCSLDSAKILASQIVVDAIITQEDKDALVGFLE